MTCSLLPPGICKLSARVEQMVTLVQDEGGPESPIDVMGPLYVHADNRRCQGSFCGEVFGTRGGVTIGQAKTEKFLSQQGCFNGLS